MIYQRILLGFCIGLSLCGSAYGDIRVLFTFDNSALIALKVVQMADSGENYPATVAELPVPPQDNVVMMQWLDASGESLAVTLMPDPRVIRSPEHIDPSSVSSVGVTEAAWMAYGPDGTETVIVEFPQNIALGLGLETWSVSLPLDN